MTERRTGDKDFVEVFSTFAGNLLQRQEALEAHIERIDAKFDSNIEEECGQMAKLNEVHEALFHPDTGLVSLTKLIKRLCTAVTWVGVVMGGIVASLAAIASAGNNFGWW